MLPESQLEDKQRKGKQNKTKQIGAAFSHREQSHLYAKQMLEKIRRDF